MATTTTQPPATTAATKDGSSPVERMIMGSQEETVAMVAGMRAGLNEMCQQGVALLPPLSPSIDESWTTVTLKDGFESRCKVMRPKTAVRGSAEYDETKKHPLVVLFYGGGFALGHPDMMTRPGRELAEQLGAVVVAPTYKLVPEHKWHDITGSGWELLAHLSRVAGEDAFGADPKEGGFLVGGASAGATVASVCAGLSQLPAGAEGKTVELAAPLTGAWLSAPMIVFSRAVLPETFRAQWTSREDNFDGDQFLDTPGCQRIENVLAADAYSAWISPFNCLEAAFPAAQNGTSEEKKKKAGPRIVVEASQLDPLRDDGLIFQKALAERGVDTRLVLYTDDGHMGYLALPYQPKTPNAGKMTMDGFAWLLEKK